MPFGHVPAEPLGAKSRPFGILWRCVVKRVAFVFHGLAPHRPAKPIGGIQVRLFAVFAQSVFPIVAVEKIAVRGDGLWPLQWGETDQWLARYKDTTGRHHLGDCRA